MFLTRIPYFYKCSSHNWTNLTSRYSPIRQISLFPSKFSDSASKPLKNPLSKSNSSASSESISNTNKVNPQPEVAGLTGKGIDHDDGTDLQEFRAKLSKGKQAKFDTLVSSLEDWTPIYHFKYIRHCRALQKLKIYQTAFTCLILTPGSIGCYFYGLVSALPMNLAIFASCLASGMLFIMGTFSNRVIGRLYVSESRPDIVRVAKLNFFGDRQDVEFEKTDFVPLDDLNYSPKDVYICLKRYSDEMDEEKLYISINYGQFLNKEEFVKIFGHP